MKILSALKNYYQTLHNQWVNRTPKTLDDLPEWFLRFAVIASAILVIGHLSSFLWFWFDYTHIVTTVPIHGWGAKGWTVTIFLVARFAATLTFSWTMFNAYFALQRKILRMQ